MSTRSISQKLQLKESQTFLLVNPPNGYESILGKLPNNLTVVAATQDQADVIQVFVASGKELETSLSTLKPKLKPKGILWVTYPKGTSKVRTNINRDSIRKYAKSIDLEAVAIFSVDNEWAALRLKKV